MAGVITYADVRVHESSAGQIAGMNLRYQKPTHSISGTPGRVGTHKIRFHAVNNWGEDYEDVTVHVLRPPAPTLQNATITTSNDIGVNYRLPGSHCTASAQDFLKATDIHWSAKNLPWGLAINPQTGYVTGLLTKKGTYTIEITCDTIYGRGVGTLTIKVVSYTFWDRAVSPECPATPGYSGNHTHGVSVTLPDGVKTISSVENRSSVVYGERRLTLQAIGKSAYNYQYTYTPLEGEPEVRNTSCYRNVQIDGIISGGRGSSSKYSKLYENAIFRGRVKFSSIPTKEGEEPEYFYIDIDFVYDFFEVPNFKYDPYGEILTYSN